MRKTSVRELHIHTSALVQEAAEGGVIVIERRGQPVAELRPLSASAKIDDAVKDRIFSSMQDLWNGLPVSRNSTNILEEDRNR